MFSAFQAIGGIINPSDASARWLCVDSTQLRKEDMDRFDFLKDKRTLLCIGVA